MSYKGFISNKKKGNLTSLTSSDVFVVEKPTEVFVETDPTVAQHIKGITTIDISNWITAFNNNLVSGSITGDINKILTLTRRDGTVIQIPFTDLAGISIDDVINTLGFNINTGVLTAVTSEGVTITTNIDGRYALLGHVHSYNDLTDKPTLVGDSYHTTIILSAAGLLSLTSTNGAPTLSINLDSRYALVGHTHTWAQITDKPILDNYDGWNLKTNGVQRIKVASGGTADFVAGTNMSISYGAGGQVIFNVPAFDNYGSWSIGANGNYTAIGSGAQVNLVGSGSVTVNRVGNTITIHGTDNTGTGADGNAYVTSGTYNNSTREITLTRNDGGTITFPLNPRKTVKTVSSSTYTLLSTDQFRWLVFTANCTVTIPTGMVVDDLFEGEADTSATVTFQAASGVTLRHVASVSKILSPNGVFGIRFKANNNCVLYGTDPTNYLNQ